MKQPHAFRLAFYVLGYARRQRLGRLSLVICGLLGGAALLQTWLAAGPGHAVSATAAPLATCTWRGGLGNWNDATKWTCNAVPGPNDTAVIAGGTVMLTAPVTVAVLQINTATSTLTGDSNLIVTGAMTWAFGKLTGKATTTIAAGARLELPGTGFREMYQRTLVIQGSALMSGGGNFFIGEQATINNQNVFEVQGNGGLYAVSGPPNTFNNNGLFRKSASPTSSLSQSELADVETTDLSLNFNNLGLTEVLAGLLNYNEGGTSSGSIKVNENAMLNIKSNFTLNPGTNLFGTGRIDLLRGALTVATDLVIETNLGLNGGTLTGPGNLTLDGELDWSSGDMTGTGKTTLRRSRRKRIRGSARKRLQRRMLVVRGDARVEDTSSLNCESSLLGRGAAGTTQPNCTPSLLLEDQAMIINEGEYELLGNGGIGSADASQKLFNNLGVFKRSRESADISPAAVNIAVDFSNSGQVHALSGTANFNGQFTQTAGTTTLNGGHLCFGTPGQFQGGLLQGIGTITGNINNTGATLNPGQSPGLLTISGNYTQGANSTLNLELGGLTPGTQYDQVAIGGTATLGGTLNVTLINGFVPSHGNVFQVLTFATRTGDFAVKNGLNAGNARLAATFNPTNLSLTAQVCAALTVNPATLPSGVLNQTYNQALSTSGGSAPINFALSAGTLPAGLTLSAAGVLAGIPTVAGPFNFTVRATDSNGCTGERAFTLVINACPTVTLSPATLPEGRVAKAYQQTLMATGGGTFSFTVSEGALPPGLSLAAASGVLAGTPTSAGTFNFTIRATSSNTCSGTQAYSLTIAALPAVASVSAASFRAESFAPEMIVAAFGTSLGAATQAATTQPLPTALAGVTVKVTDSASAERLAQLFFVSPQQINYLLPAGLAKGRATVTVLNGNEIAAAGTLQINDVSPGLFTANASGQGVPAAFAIQVKANGEQVFLPVAQFDTQQNRFLPVPLEVGAAGERLFLVLFGTGLRFRSGLDKVTVKLGGVEAPIFFAGAQGQLDGLDQLNLEVPATLAGRGLVNVELSVDGQAANTVQIALK
jgi:uncharacterized protein (TIGR03437 family)